MDEIQTGIRCYIITGDETCITSFNKSVKEIRKTERIVDSMLLDFPRQHQTIETVSEVLNRFVKSKQELLSVRQLKGFEAARELFAKKEKENLANTVRNLLLSIQNEEYTILEKQKAENERSIQTGSALIALFVLLCIALLVIAFVVIYENTKLRNKAEAKIRELNSSLSGQVKEKTQEVIRKERQYRFLIENMREGVQVLAPDWKYVFLNDSAAGQGQKKKEELMAYSLLEKYPGIENSELFKVLKRCMEERVAKTFENERLSVVVR